MVFINSDFKSESLEKLRIPSYNNTIFWKEAE